jgi:Fic family protein
MGFQNVRRNKLLTYNHILTIQQELEQNNVGLRKLPGTALKNAQTGETVYTPPQDYDSIYALMQNLVEYINNDDLSEVDPLIKMAVVHHQFESIHPFYDGNGRTGRIINILYLVIKDLLNLPILYLSRYIIEHKQDYYKLLQTVRDTGEWEEWVLFVLRGIENTSQQTIDLIKGIKQLMQSHKHRIRTELPKIYSQDLINNLFRHPYTKIEFLERDLMVTRKTAASYLDQLIGIGILHKEKVGKSNFYLNPGLVQVIMNSGKPECG